MNYKNFFLFKSILVVFFVFAGINTYASSTVHVKAEGPYDVKSCGLNKDGLDKLKGIYNGIAAAPKGSTLDTLLTEDEINFLQDYCYDKQYCNCQTLNIGQEATYISESDMQIVMANGIKGTKEFLLAVLIAIAVVFTVVTAGLAAPVFGLKGFIVAIGLSTFISTINNAAVILALYGSAFIVSLGLTAGAWIMVGDVFKPGNPSGPTHLIGDLTQKEFDEIPPVIIGYNPQTGFIVPLFDGERLRFTGAAQEQSFSVANDKIKQQQDKLFPNDRDRNVAVFNNGGYAMQACYGRECVHILSGKTFHFKYIKNQELLVIIQEGPIVQPLKVEADDYVKFWNTVKTPLYEVRSKVSIQPDKTKAPICVNAVPGIGYIGGLCYAGKCSTISLTDHPNQKFSYVEGELMSIKAMAGNFVSKQGVAEKDKNQNFINPDDIVPGSTLDIYGTTGDPQYTVNRGTCTWEGVTPPTGLICVKAVTGIAYVGKVCYPLSDCHELALGNTIKFNYVERQTMTIQALGTGIHVQKEGAPTNGVKENYISWADMAVNNTINIWGLRNHPLYSVTKNDPNCK